MEICEFIFPSRFLLKFLSYHMLLGAKLLGNSFPIQWKFQGNFNENSVITPWKFCTIYTEIPWKLYRSGIEYLLHWYYNHMDTWRPIPWKFQGNLWVHISLRFLLKFLSFYMLLGGEIAGKFISNSMEIPRKFQWKFCWNSMEITQKFYGCSIEMV